MYTHRLLVLPLLISVCVAPVAAQSSSDKTSSSASVCPASKCSDNIRFDQLHVPLHWDRNGAAKHSSTTIPPIQLHAIPPLEGALGPTLGQSVCYSIRSYRVTRDDPESDSTRPAGYSTCQPAARFDVKDAGD